MKAKIKSTGEIVEVRLSRFSFRADDPECDYTDSNGNHYQESELEFINGIESEATIKGWIARDKNDWLYIYDKNPMRMQTHWTPCVAGKWDLRLDGLLFPQITWDSEPCKVEITIKIKEK